MTARLMLERKGIEHRRIDLLPAIHKPILWALRFEKVTVPALKIHGRRIQGSRNISRALDEVQAVTGAPLITDGPPRVVGV